MRYDLDGRNNRSADEAFWYTRRAMWAWNYHKTKLVIAFSGLYLVVLSESKNINDKSKRVRMLDLTDLNKGVHNIIADLFISEKNYDL